MTNKQRRHYTPTFVPYGGYTKEIVKGWKHAYLDHRLKAISDDERTNRVVASFLGYKLEPFNVLLTHVNETDRECVKAVLNAFVGPILTREGGRNTYKFRPEFANQFTQIATEKKEHQHKLVSKEKAIYSDYSYLSRPPSDFEKLDYRGVILVEIVAPMRTMAIYSGDAPSPGLNWLSLEEQPQYTTEANAKRLDNLSKNLIHYCETSATSILPLAKPGTFFVNSMKKFRLQLSRAVGKTFK